MGVEAVQAQYEAGLYQIISCHTDDDAAAELTPGLAFPVNAAANQTHLPPFTLSSSVSSRPASVSSPSHLCSLSSMFDRSPLHPLPFFSSLSLSPRFHTVRDSAVSSASWASTRKEATNDSARRRFAVTDLGICIRGIYNWPLFILCQVEKESQLFRGQERWSIQPFVASFVSSLLEFTGGIGTVLNDEDLGKKLLAPRESRVLTKEIYIRYMTTYIRNSRRRNEICRWFRDWIFIRSFGNINIRQLILIELCYM